MALPGKRMSIFCISNPIKFISSILSFSRFEIKVLESKGSKWNKSRDKSKF